MADSEYLTREALVERVAALENALRLKGTRSVASFFALPPILAKLLELLVALPFVNQEAAEEQLGICKDLKVAICRLRRELEPRGIKIKSRRFTGYWLDEATKASIQSLLTAESNPPAQED
jgi:hypothetical protein